MTAPDKQARGERHGQSRLTADLVRQMRYDHYQNGKSYAQLAKELGVSYTAVKQAVTGITWGHISAIIR